jgi:hypothetical protein
MMLERKNRILLSIFSALLVLFFAGPALTAQQRPDMSKKVGDRAPIFSVATSQDYLASYDRDYYGKHHLLLTFFPAAFTPV